MHEKMIVFLRSTLSYSCVYVVFVICQLRNVKSQNNHSFYSFARTEMKSPTDIDDSCLTLDNSTLGSSFSGLTLFLLKTTKNNTCRPSHIELKEIRKNIILDEHGRRVCRTEYIMYFNNKNCETIVQYICKGNNTNTIYFQECKELDDNTNETARKDREAITMSEFPISAVYKDGPVYKIPKTHCNIKRFNSESSTKQSTITTEVTSTEKSNNGNQEHHEKSSVVFAVIGSGLAGLVVGVLVTSLTFILTRKCMQSRNINDVISPKSNILMTGGERKFSIHSKEEMAVYHDISDIPGTSKMKEAFVLPSMSNVLVHGDHMEQRYSESPKSSTSANANSSLTSQSSSNKTNFQTNDPNVSIQQSQMYHTLSKDDDVECTGKQKLPSTISEYIQETFHDKASFPETSNMPRTISEEICENFKSTEYDLQTKISKVFSLESSVTTTEASPGVYHVLQKMGKHQTDSESEDTTNETTENDS